MRISPIASPKSFVRKNPNFKADISLIQSAAKDNPSREDTLIAQRTATKLKKELERRYGGKDDNLQIILQPGGFRKHNDKRVYYNRVYAHLGYKDAERARKEIINNNTDPNSASLEPETITALKQKNSEIMEKLQNKYPLSSEIFRANEKTEDIEEEFIDDVDNMIKYALPYYLTEYVEEPLIIPTSVDPASFFFI